VVNSENNGLVEDFCQMSDITEADILLMTKRTDQSTSSCDTAVLVLLNFAFS